MYTCVYGVSNSTATFDVQEVSVSEGPGTVSITCTFAEGSLANGCHAIIRAENISDIAMNISRVEQNGEEQSQTAVGEVAGLEIGVYEVSVFDLESDNTIDLQNPVQIVEVNVTDVQPTSPPTTSGALVLPTRIHFLFPFLHNRNINNLHIRS